MSYSVLTAVVEVVVVVVVVVAVVVVEVEVVVAAIELDMECGKWKKVRLEEKKERKEGILLRLLYRNCTVTVP